MSLFYLFFVYFFLSVVCLFDGRESQFKLLSKWLVFFNITRFGSKRQLSSSSLFHLKMEKNEVRFLQFRVTGIMMRCDFLRGIWSFFPQSRTFFDASGFTVSIFHIRLSKNIITPLIPTCTSFLCFLFKRTMPFDRKRKRCPWFGDSFCSSSCSSVPSKFLRSDRFSGIHIFTSL